jgi:mediator of RNA polymerase II transcription subunit 14
MTQSLPLMNVHSLPSGPVVNGINGHRAKPEMPTLEELESELPVVYNDQVPLSEVLSRVVQDIYAELMTLSDTSASIFLSQCPHG